jgi:hypothetical protein
MKRKIIKAWITRNALTQGIFTIKAELCTDISDKMIKSGELHECYHKPDWHESWDAAVAQAEKMRVNKIVSIKKQIKRLEELKFVEVKA